MDLRSSGADDLYGPKRPSISFLSILAELSDIKQSGDSFLEIIF
jgi:hypothetical protein